MRKQISDVVKRSINVNNKRCCYMWSDIQYCFGLNINIPSPFYSFLLEVCDWEEILLNL